MSFQGQRDLDEIFQKILPFFRTTTIIFIVFYGLALAYSNYFYDWALSLPVNLATLTLYFQFTFYLFHILLRLQHLSTILKKNRMKINQDTNVLEYIYINISEMVNIYNYRFFWSIGFFSSINIQISWRDLLDSELFQ